MATTATLRRLLALLAFFTPAALLHRADAAQAGTAVGAECLSSPAETVFRHYV